MPPPSHPPFIPLYTGTINELITKGFVETMRNTILVVLVLINLLPSAAYSHRRITKSNQRVVPMPAKKIL